MDSGDSPQTLPSMSPPPGFPTQPPTFGWDPSGDTLKCDSLRRAPSVTYLQTITCRTLPEGQPLNVLNLMWNPAGESPQCSPAYQTTTFASLQTSFTMSNELAVQFGQLQRFIEITRRIWLEIVPPGTSRPISLPVHVAGFLSSVLKLPSEIVQLSWHAFADLAEALFLDPGQPSLDDNFRLHAHDYKIGTETIGPPITSCTHPSCDSARLGEPSVVEARLYTLHRGILPVFSKSLYCRKCHTRYYYNYFVQNASDPAAHRVYYSIEVPDIIHVTETSFVERQLCTYFEMQMAVSHAPSQAIANVYNLALGGSDIPNASRLIHQLTGEVVLDSFLFHAILRDKRKRREVLSVPHGSYQNHRLDQALAERNYHMAGTGQDMWAHACDKCMKIYQGEDQQWY
ncbi:hypothetical protein C8J57DRAFT_1224805 [Mycena rebaudengoi]|nr:hypothetical protein C8J57DRAFT_1224805 [Mycena rebaudengoi]